MADHSPQVHSGLWWCMVVGLALEVSPHDVTLLHSLLFTFTASGRREVGGSSPDLVPIVLLFSPGRSHLQAIRRVDYDVMDWLDAHVARLGQASCGAVHTWSCSEVNWLRYFTAHARGSFLECGGHESTHLLQLQSSWVLETSWCIESPL